MPGANRRNRLGVVLFALLALSPASCVVEGSFHYLEIRNTSDDVVTIMQGDADWRPVHPGETAKYPIRSEDGCRDRPVLRALVAETEVARLGPKVCAGVWEISASGSTYEPDA